MVEKSGEDALRAEIEAGIAVERRLFIEDPLWSDAGARNCRPLDMMCIVPDIWLGSINAVKAMASWQPGGGHLAEKAMRATGVTRVLSVAVECRGKFQLPTWLEHTVADADDVGEYNLLAKLEDMLAFIDGAIASGGGVLVHCMAGHSRSASVVISWLMRRYQLPLKPVLQLVSTRRDIGPNEGFLRQLIAFANLGWQVPSHCNASAATKAVDQELVQELLGEDDEVVEVL
eukprot:Sspe_Gene.30379::Locus_15040_Transcript_1_1_Confidence_1.000_Length_778::g.30379::m.30379/K17614/DUSP3, VHR; dual specificity phosphatase 3